MEKTGVIYSFNTQKTSQVVKMLTEAMGEESIELINAEDITEKLFLTHKNNVLGVPTWFDGELPNYWDEFIPALQDMDLKGRKFALFGNGDQKGYPENFVDGIGIMASILEKQGAAIVGFTPVEGYTFESSRALRGDMFVGLALDFENQPKKNKERIKAWAEKIKKEFQ